MLPFKYWLPAAVTALMLGTAPLHAQQINWDNWITDTGKKLISLDELVPGGPRGRDRPDRCL